MPALFLIVFLGGCGKGGQPVANETKPALTPQVAAPINNSAQADAAAAATPTPPPLPADEPKPLVSRGTSPHQTAAPDYRAIGTEPFWAVTVRGSTATLERPDRPPIRYAIRQGDDDGALRMSGDGFTLTATEGPCSDGMSDAIWSDRVQIAFGEGTLKGCGGIREEMREDRREDWP